MTRPRALRINLNSPFQQMIAVGGMGSGMFFALEQNHTLGRNESRPAELLNVKDYGKLHIVSHYVSVLLGCDSSEAFQVIPVGKVGDDTAGHLVIQEMRKVGIDTRFVQIDRKRPTLFSVCFQYPDGSGGNITTNNSAASGLKARDLDDLTPLLASKTNRTIALSLPETPLETRQFWLSKAAAAGAFCAASFVSSEIATAQAARMFELLDLVALNECEAAELVGSTFSVEEPEPFIQQCLLFLQSSYPRLRMIVSVGKRGAYGFTRDGWSHCPAPEVEVASTAGAGDALLAGVIAGLAAGMEFVRAEPSAKNGARSLQTALNFGVLLASYSVTSPHSIHPSVSLAALLDFADQLDVKFESAPEQICTGDSPQDTTH